MHPSLVAFIVLVCVSGGAALGLWLRVALPDQHLTSETKEVVRLATGLIATMAALVLGLLVSSAQSTFDAVNDELLENAARVLLLDRTLDEYGPEADEVRGMIKADYARQIELAFSRRKAEHAKLDGAESVAQQESIDAKLWGLAPRGATQQGLQTRALEINGEIEMTRALMHVQQEEPVPAALLTVLVSWLVVIFAAFGMFAPRNTTVVIALFVCALSTSGAVMLILEMKTPFSGILNVSRAPLDDTLNRLGQ